MLIGSAFAAFESPSVTINLPSSGQKLTTGNFTIDFNVIDYNATANNRVSVPQLKLYYSNTAGAFTNLIVWDTNLNNATTMTCADANFVNTTNCTYAWAIPTTFATGTYFIDYNLMDNNNGGTMAYTNFTGSSSSFIVQQLSADSNLSGCGLIVLIVPLFGMLLAFFVVMQLMAGKFSPALVSLSIAGVIGIVIVWGFGSAICVI